MKVISSRKIIAFFLPDAHCLCFTQIAGNDYGFVQVGFGVPSAGAGAE
jgi:hypothetical protein